MALYVLVCLANFAIGNIIWGKPKADFSLPFLGLRWSAMEKINFMESLN